MIPASSNSEDFRYPNLRFVRDRKRRFDLLNAGHWLDFTSGAWRHPNNVRRAKCGRCERTLEAGQGDAYNEFMSDGYRTVTRYICAECKAAHAETEEAYWKRVNAELEKGLI